MGILNQPSWARGKKEGWKEEGKEKYSLIFLDCLVLADGTNTLQNVGNMLPTSTVKHPSRQCSGTLKSCIVCGGRCLVSLITQSVTAWLSGIHVQHNKSGLLDVHGSCFPLYSFWSSWSFPRDEEIHFLAYNCSQ